MEFWPEFLANSFGKELVAGGIGGMAGVLSGHPFDTLRVRLQQPPTRLPAAAAASGACAATTTAAASSPARGGAVSLLRSILASEGPGALYRGMAAPLTSVTLQNAMVFQAHAILSRALDPTTTGEPPSYRSVAFAGVGTGAVQSFLLSPVELLKIRLQLQTSGHRRLGPVPIARDILKHEGLRGLYRGLLITVLRDAPAFGVYFFAYEYAKELLHPGCRRTGDERLRTMLVAGGLAGVASWVCCYPLDVVKSRLQAQTRSSSPAKYAGIADCVRKSVAEEGGAVLFRGLGTAVTRAFVVNGAIFTVQIIHVLDRISVCQLMCIAPISTLPQWTANIFRCILKFSTRYG